MRWPWISRAVHEDVVGDLRARLAECETERKKAQDEMIRLLGGKPYNFPQPQPDAQAEPFQTSEEEEPDPVDDEMRHLAYLARNKPSQFPQVLASVMARGIVPRFTESKPAQPPASRNSDVDTAFEQAEQEVKQKVNGHTTA